MRRSPTVLVLAVATAGSSLTIDLYLPGLPRMATSLGTSSSLAQLSLSACLIGIAAGQLLLGPISDVAGRRRVLLAGSTAFAVFSLLCAAAPNIEVLIAARFGLGIAGGCGVAVSRAVVAELFHGAAASRAQAVLAGAMAVEPIVASAVGGTILSLGSWRGVFVVLALVGICQFAGVLRSVPEPAFAAAGRQRFRDTGRVVVRLLADRVLAGYVVGLALSGAAAFVYIAGTPFLLQGAFGLSAASTSVVYGTNAVGALAGSVLYGVLTTRVVQRRILICTAGLMLGFVTLLAVLLTLGARSLAVTWGCLFLYVTAFGVFFPAVITAGQERGRSAPGATSSLLSGHFLLGAVVTSLTAYVGTGDGRPMATVMAVCLAAATLALITLSRENSRKDIDAAKSTGLRGRDPGALHAIRRGPVQQCDPGQRA